MNLRIQVISEIKKTDIPAVVMGKIHKSGQMDFIPWAHQDMVGRNVGNRQEKYFENCFNPEKFSSVDILMVERAGKLRF